MARWSRGIAFSSALLVVLFISPSALTPLQAQTTATSSSSQTVEGVLRHLFDRAGIIFAGQVLSIRHLDASGSSSGFVEVQFRVDTAIRGCTAGSIYTVREWNGLWTADAYRYGIGQRLLMFLYTPGPSGMSSPVEGLDGAIPVRQGSGVEDASGQTLPYADLRWLGARIVRQISYRPSRVPSRAMSSAAVTSTASSATSLATVSGESSTPAQQASVALILNMLTAWQKGQQDAP